MNNSSLGLFASIAKAVISFCMAFIKAMTVIERSVDMAKAAVDNAAEEQAIDLEIRKIGYVNQRINDATIQHAKQDELLQNYASGNHERQKLVDQTKQVITERVNKRLAELSGVPR